jgi:hypothetical protein
LKEGDPLEGPYDFLPVWPLSFFPVLTPQALKKAAVIPGAPCGLT